MNTVKREMEDFFSWSYTYFKDFISFGSFFIIEIIEMKNTVFERKISLDGINSNYILQKKRSMNLKAKQQKFLNMNHRNKRQKNGVLNDLWDNETGLT